VISKFLSMDPLSVTVSALSIAKVCVSVILELKQFIEETKTVGTTINALYQDVKGFNSILEMLKSTLDDETIKGSIQSSGFIGSHWSHMRVSLADAVTLLHSLQDAIKRTSKSVNILDAARKQMRVNSSSKEFARYRERIQSFHHIINVSLQSVILWNQASSQQTSGTAIQRLDGVENEIRKQGIAINSRIALLEQLIRSKALDNAESSQETLTEPESELKTMTNLRECLKSSASVVSTTSTVVGRPRVANTATSTIYASDWGDVFPADPSQSTLDWIQSNSVDAVTDSSSGYPLSGVASGEQLALSNDEQPEILDSDEDEVETELTRTLLHLGVSKAEKKEFPAAENYLKNCLKRIPIVQNTSSQWSSRLELKSEVMGHLTDVLKSQNKWEEAGNLIKDRLKLLPHGGRGTSNIKYSLLILDLGEVLHYKGDQQEALVYGRKSYREFKKMGPENQLECNKSLFLLVQICKSLGNQTESDAYFAILQRQTPISKTISPHGPVPDGSSNDSYVVPVVVEHDDAILRKLSGMSLAEMKRFDYDFTKECSDFNAGN
jgi:tetratricopeptide (TPR) repeat protein